MSRPHRLSYRAVDPDCQHQLVFELIDNTKRKAVEEKKKKKKQKKQQQQQQSCDLVGDDDGGVAQRQWDATDSDVEQTDEGSSSDGSGNGDPNTFHGLSAAEFNAARQHPTCWKCTKVVEHKADCKCDVRTQRVNKAARAADPAAAATDSDDDDVDDDDGDGGDDGDDGDDDNQPLDELQEQYLASTAAAASVRSTVLGADTAGSGGGGAGGGGGRGSGGAGGGGGGGRALERGRCPYSAQQLAGVRWLHGVTVACCSLG